MKSLSNCAIYIKCQLEYIHKFQTEIVLMQYLYLIKNKILRKEVLPNEYLFLYKRFQILGDFCFSSAEVTKPGLNKKLIKEYSEIINQSIFPYLTDKGKKEYLELTN